MSLAHDTLDRGPSLRARARPLGRAQRVTVAVVELWLGVGALYGGWNLLRDAEAFGLERSWLDGTPFPDYTVPGLTLLVVIGGGMLAAAGLTVAGSRHAGLAALVMGVLMLGFLLVETVLIGYQGSQQVPLVAGVAAGALVLVAIGLRSLRGRGGAP